MVVSFTNKDFVVIVSSTNTHFVVIVSSTNTNYVVIVSSTTSREDRFYYLSKTLVGGGVCFTLYPDHVDPDQSVDTVKRHLRQISRVGGDWL